jgi:cysteine desulfurase
MKRVYMDYAATTPVDPEVLRAMEPYFTGKFGNPGSLHAFGQEAIAAVDHAREAIAGLLGAEFRQVVFTASATEANNLALRGAVAQFKRTHPRAVPHILVSVVEHESVRETARALESEGCRVTYLPVNAAGTVDTKELKERMTPETALVSVMYANNEVGTIQPIAEIAALVKAMREGNGGETVRGERTGAYPLLHTDAAQACQFLDCNAQALGVDLMTISSHKIYGPKGAAALYVRDLALLAPLETGGGQEFALRSGTENVPAIVGFARAATIAAEKSEKEYLRTQELRGLLWKEIKKILPEASMNGPQEDTDKLPHILNVYFPGREAQDLLTRFDLNGLAASSGSACRARAVEASYVIEALGYPKARARSSIRLSLGRPTTEEEVSRAVEIIKRAL